MTNYNHIVCPRTGVLHSLQSPEGLHILKRYVTVCLQPSQVGGIFETFVVKTITFSNREPISYTEVEKYKKYFDKNVIEVLDSKKDKDAQLKERMTAYDVSEESLKTPKLSNIKTLFRSSEYGIVMATFSDRKISYFTKMFKKGILTNKPNSYVKKELNNIPKFKEFNPVWIGSTVFFDFYHYSSPSGQSKNEDANMKLLCGTDPTKGMIVIDVRTKKVHKIKKIVESNQIILHHALYYPEPSNLISKLTLKLSANFTLVVQPFGVLGISQYIKPYPKPSIPDGVCIVDPANSGTMKRKQTTFPNVGGASAAIYKFLNKSATTNSIEKCLEDTQEKFQSNGVTEAKYVSYTPKDNSQGQYHVIHTVGPDYRSLKEFKRDSLRDTYTNIFKEFFSDGCPATTLRLLPVSAGIFAFNGRPNTCDTLNAIKKAVESNTQFTTTSKQVHLCIYNGKILDYEQACNM